MNTNNYLSFLEEKEELPTTLTTNAFDETEPDYINLSTIQEEPELDTIDVIKVPVLKRQTVIDFLSTRYKKDIKKVIGNKLIKDNLSTCLIIALQVELNKKGANLLVDGKFYGDTKTAYALKKKELVQKGTDSIFVLIWKYILSQKGSQYQCTNMDTYFDDECDKFTREYQKRIKTAADGIVGFSVLAEALKF